VLSFDFAKLCTLEKKALGQMIEQDILYYITWGNISKMKQYQ
jgi:hypothetical protein